MKLYIFNLVLFFLSQNILCAQNNQFNSTKLGNQIWMTENLNVERFRNGDIIEHIVDNKQWEMAGYYKKPAWCFYNNDPSTEGEYGRIYNLWAVLDARGLAPEGWHVPSKEEFEQMIIYLGGPEKIAAVKSKSGWSVNKNGNNSSNLNFLPSGYRYFHGEFTTPDALSSSVVGFWTSTPVEDKSPGAWRCIISDLSTEIRLGEDISNCGYAVRCIKNNESSLSNNS
jgi:uncharacterized protein (TIGR02145 family)